VRREPTWGNTLSRIIVMSGRGLNCCLILIAVVLFSFVGTGFPLEDGANEKYEAAMKIRLLRVILREPS
jgi:hypothetical protein